MRRPIRFWLPISFFLITASASAAGSLSSRLPSAPPDPSPADVAAIQRPRAAVPARWRPGELLVVVDEVPGVGGAMSWSAHEPEAVAALGRMGISRVERVGRGPMRGGRSMYRLRSDQPGFDPVLAAEALRRTGRFRAVAPNFEMQLLLTPNDPFLSSQWQASPGDPGAISLPQAWDLQRGNPGVLVCVFDVGIDVGHPDLAGKIWVNPGEIPANHLDDDGNGHVDDVQGWDFGDDDADPSPTPLFQAVGPPFEPDSIDVAFHGTFCAGLTLASTDNGQGGAGVDWNARLVAVKVSDSDGLIYTDRFAAAMHYAVDAGARVMNISLGVPDAPGARELFQAIVDIALEAGAIVVASAGNDGVSSFVYPAACDSVIAVASTSSGGALSSFSNHGPWVDIAAPGDAVFSCIHRNYDIDFLSDLYYFLFFGWNFLDPYMMGSGTSFSGPLVAGAASLVLAEFPGDFTGPGASRRMRDHLIATGDSMAFTPTIGGTPGDNRKLNVWKAVSRPGPLAVKPPGSRTGPLAAWPNPASRGSSLAFTLARAGSVRLAVFDLSGRRVRAVHDGPLGAGRHVFPWAGVDDLGRPVAPGVYDVVLESDGDRQRQRVVRLR
jgi:subtilisin family serine protease